MRKIFLPKAINNMSSMQYCVSSENGASSTDMHWHDCIEIIYIDEGDALVFFNNKWNRVGAKTIVFIPPGRVHCCKCTNPESKRIVIGVTTKLVGITGDKELPFSGDKIDGFCITEANKEMQNSLITAAELECTHPCAYQYLIQSEILKLYAHMYILWDKENVLQKIRKENKLIKFIKKRISDDFVNPPDALKMAEELNISYSYMYKLLRRELNISYEKLLQTERIGAAKKLLLTTDKSITEIALDCGFCDSSYFTKIFKRYAGITPKKYRNRKEDI